MNKYQESLEMYHRVAEGRSIIIDDRTHYERLQELVNKEKAMKPGLYEVNKYDDHFHKCPKCGCEIGYRILKSTLFKYCSECGQKLDWKV